MPGVQGGKRSEYGGFVLFLFGVAGILAGILDVKL